MTRTVRDVMATPVVTVRPDTPFKQVAARVRAAGTVPVTDDSGLVRGIVCERDLLAKKIHLGRPAGRLAAMVRRVEGVVGLRDQMQYSAGSTTECALLVPQSPWLSRATAALTQAFR